VPLESCGKFHPTAAPGQRGCRLDDLDDAGRDGIGIGNTVFAAVIIVVALYMLARNVSLIWA